MRPAIASARVSRWRSPPERSRGSLSRAPARPTRSSAACAVGARQLVADAVAHDHLRRALRRQGDPARGASTEPAAGSTTPAAARSRVVLPAPLRPIRTTRSPRRMSSEIPRSTRSGPVPASSSTQSRRASSAGAADGPNVPADPHGRHCGTFGGWGLDPALGQRAARVLHADRQRPDPEPVEEASRRASRAPGRTSTVDSRNAPRRPVEAQPALGERDHPVGGRQAALEPMLGDQDGRAPLLVQPAQQRRSARRRRPGRAARSARRGGSAAACRRAPRPAPRAAARRRRGMPSAAPRSRSIPSASATSSTARARAAGGLAADLERQLELAADGRRDDLGLGLLGDHARPARPRSAGP